MDVGLFMLKIGIEPLTPREDRLETNDVSVCVTQVSVLCVVSYFLSDSELFVGSVCVGGGVTHQLRRHK